MIYVNSYAQISAQQPLSEDFFLNPVPCREKLCRSVEARYSDFIHPVAARRMGPLVRRAVATTVTAMRSAGMESADAIIFGTGLGCIENTEKFLASIIENGEKFLQPTYFINSTHNTIASQVAVYLKCHGYNCTYSHLGVSFESALLDALMQFELGRIHTAVVGGQDEMTPSYHSLLDGILWWDAPYGECSAVFCLSDRPSEGCKCILKDVGVFSGDSTSQAKARLAEFLERNCIAPQEIGCVVTGRDGDTRYDGSYDELMSIFPSGTLQCRYRHLFGESFTSSAFGMMTAAQILCSGQVPEPYRYCGDSESEFKNILIVNSFQSRDWSFILLQK